MSNRKMEKNLKPFILNLNKPPGISSQTMIRQWKPKLRGMGKIGHFGTLDPFAQGVLMLGIGGAQRLNEYIHQCLPKTYLAKGILGVETATGDMTEEISQRDESDYFKVQISEFSEEFLQKIFCERFLGEYWQAPHAYSAAKYEGKALHKWAREGIEIKKEKKLRNIYAIEVVKYDFPKLWVRFSVSSGTYIRTLFSDCAQELGTLGVLEDLIRESIGCCTLSNTITDQNSHESSSFINDGQEGYFNVEDVLNFSSIYFNDKELQLYRNGVRLKIERVSKIKKGSLDFPYFWAKDFGDIIYGLCEIVDGEIHSRINFGN